MQRYASSSLACFEDSEKVRDGFTCGLFLGGQQFFSSWIERAVQAELNVG